MHVRARESGPKRRLVLGGAFAVLLLYALATPPLFELPYFGMTLRVDRIDRTAPDGPAARAGIEPGDRLVAASGERLTGNPFFGERFYSGALGRSVRARLVSPYGVKDLVLESERTPIHQRWEEAALVVTGVGFVLIALYVALQIETTTAIVFYLLGIGFAVVLLPISPPAPAGLPHVFASVRAIAAFFLPPLTLHFFLLFPLERGILKNYPPIVRWIYVPALASLAIFVYVAAAVALGRNAPGGAVLLIGVERLTTLTFLAYAILALSTFVSGYLKVRSPVERHRYSVVLWATVLGVTPLVAGVLVHTIWANLEIPWERFTLVGLLAVPLGFAYAIVRHGLFDIEVIVKRSAAFSLLTACLVAITIGAYLIFGRMLEDLTGRQSPWLMIGSLVLIAGLFSPLRHRIEGIVDRTFYRDRYDERRVLRELGQGLPAKLDLGELLTEIVEKLSRALRVREAAIFLSADGEGAYQLAYASGLPVDDLDLPAVPPRLVELLERARRPVRALDAEHTLPFGSIEAGEERLLTVFAGGVLVPCGESDELLAVLALGRRAGGEAYGLEDIELLRAIAGQATVGMRNAILHRRTIEQERITRELAVAREIQRHLLPARHPAIDGFEITGGTEACTEIGGDFYDYLALPGGRLGLAVGDVSGHGVPAALVMAAVSATLRSEAMRYDDPGDLLARLNARACESLEPGQFVSLFYAILDPHTREVRYANAGHPPPLVLEPAGKVVQLATGGLLLGVDPESRYRTDDHTLRPGSLSLLYTDGLVESRRNDIEFGEERLVELARSAAGEPVAVIHARILEAARAFAGGDAADDVTLLVTRVTGSESAAG